MFGHDKIILNVSRITIDMVSNFFRNSNNNVTVYILFSISFSYRCGKEQKKTSAEALRRSVAHHQSRLYFLLKASTRPFAPRIRCFPV